MAVADWDGADYQRRIDAVADSGQEMHGEVAFVQRFQPRRVLDAGCGTGRVAIELHARGIDVDATDVSASMLTVARERQPEINWIEADLAGTTKLRADHYDVTTLAGNVLIFVEPGTEAAVVATAAATIVPGGRLVTGFSLRPDGYDLVAFDAHCAAAGLELEERWSTWERGAFEPDGDYHVSVHRRGAPAGS